jgi:hypothetical protein
MSSSKVWWRITLNGSACDGSGNGDGTIVGGDTGYSIDRFGGRVVCI